ncbi:hypothetical protein CR513_17972, partial [Mucuna pruriens]
MTTPNYSYFATNPSNHYYMHPNENPSLILVTPLLDSKNYQIWAKTMKVALISKNKLKFVDGCLPPPQLYDLLYEALIRCNSRKGRDRLSQLKWTGAETELAIVCEKGTETESDKWCERGSIRNRSIDVEGAKAKLAKWCEKGLRRSRPAGVVGGRGGAGQLEWKGGRGGVGQWVWKGWTIRWHPRVVEK